VGNFLLRSGHDFMVVFRAGTKAAKTLGNVPIFQSNRKGIVMRKIIKCPKCGKDAQGSGGVSCWCDKDWCTGQRCGADHLAENFECPACGANGQTPEANAYYARYAPKD